MAGKPCVMRLRAPRARSPARFIDPQRVAASYGVPDLFSVWIAADDNERFRAAWLNADIQTAQFWIGKAVTAGARFQCGHAFVAESLAHGR